uniref:Uracil phosphoribosyltransferase n=1 Tax=candidate division WOR-3 bacterium TaxID=2052148 RepID=A0A7C4UDF2_UNCW3
MLIVFENPLLKTIITEIRDKNADKRKMRENLRLCGFLSTYEILSREMEFEVKKVQTPLSYAKGITPVSKILQVVVLRAAIPFAEGGTNLIDKLGIDCSIGFVDAKRIQKEGNLNFDVEITSVKIPDWKNRIVIIYDPMLATGSTLIDVIKRIKGKKIIINSIISAPYGVEKIEKEFKDVSIYTVELDKEGKYNGLNSKGYIVPGLGDCGDRALGEF